LKISDRLATKKFFCDILGMRILRHEEMSSGCSAQCNGNFESPWSKTVVGYGDEHSSFAFELNYNYDVQGYKYGNDFASVTIHHRQAICNAQEFMDQSQAQPDKQSLVISSPDGHRIILVDREVEQGEDPIKCLSLNVYNLEKSVDYYTRLLNMSIVEQHSDDKKRVKLAYNAPKGSKKNTRSTYNFRLDNQCQLELIESDKPIDRGTGYGRIAFSCPIKDVDVIQSRIEKESCKVLIPKMKLGGLFDINKNTVVILSDPDEHEVRRTQ
jgi:catechol 2,3-dioxygenase-like lactoylglutathione lyase family enzyme